MRRWVQMACVVLAGALVSCSGSSSRLGGAGGRSLVASPALSPTEVADHTAALAHVAGDQVTLSHLATNIVAVESTGTAMVTADERYLLTLSWGELKQWSLADGSLHHVERIDQNPQPWARPIYLAFSDYTTGFERGISRSYFNTQLVPVDGDTAVFISRNEHGNWRFDLQTGAFTRYNNTFDGGSGVIAAGPGRYATIPTETSTGIDLGLRYDLVVGDFNGDGASVNYQVNPSSELDNHKGKLPMIARAKLSGYDAPRQALYLTRTTMDLQWVLDAIDISPDHSAREPRRQVAKLGAKLFGNPGGYSDCAATLSADGRYAAVVMTPSENYQLSIVKVVELSSGKTLGQVGPAALSDTKVVAFANGLLTFTTKVGPLTTQEALVLTFSVPDLKQVESLKLTLPEKDASDSRVMAISPSHRFIAVRTYMEGDVASMTVYDLSAGKALVLDDDAPTRQYAVKYAAQWRDANAALPGVLARAEEKAKMAIADRVAMERSVRELMTPPVYNHPPAPLFQRSTRSGNPCSKCGGSGVVVVTNTRDQHTEYRQTLHGWEKSFYARDTSISTEKCPRCNGSGRAD